jgi:hypothetical protein
VTPGDMTTVTVAAIGMAVRAPTKPRSVPPTDATRRTTADGRSTVLRKMRRAVDRLIRSVADWARAYSVPLPAARQGNPVLNVAWKRVQWTVPCG